MSDADKKRDLLAREAPLEMSAKEFRSLGHLTVDRIADFLASLREGPDGVAAGVGAEGAACRAGAGHGDAGAELLEETVDP
jgi:hypothetical protein